MIILSFALNVVSHQKNHSQVNLSSACLPSYIAKLTFRQNSKIRASIAGLQKSYSQFLETNKVFKAKRQLTHPHPISGKVRRSHTPTPLCSGDYPSTARDLPSKSGKCSGTARGF